MNAFVRAPLAISNLKITMPTADPTGKADSQIRIWTDGACIGNPGPGGWAFAAQRIVDGEVIKDVDVSGSEPFETTNNRMEMQAVVEALKIIPRNETAPITITSDSQIVINGMTKWLPSWIKNGWKNAKREPVANRDLWDQILELSHGLNITWVWIKGHAGHAQNERVDGLAEDAARAAVVASFTAE